MDRFRWYLDIYLVVEIPEYLTMKMVKSNKDILVPTCVYRDNGEYYDKNSWVGVRTPPTDSQMRLISLGRGYDEHGFYPYSLGPNLDRRPWLPHLSHLGDFVELDSVGGTMLYIKSKGIYFLTSHNRRSNFSAHVHSRDKMGTQRGLGWYRNGGYLLYCKSSWL